jgi:hypothetical protein
MSKTMVFLIRGMAVIGALLILSIPFFFSSPISTTLIIVSSISLIAFVMFTVSAIRLRKRIEDE